MERFVELSVVILSLGVVSLAAVLMFSRVILSRLSMLSDKVGGEETTVDTSILMR